MPKDLREIPPGLSPAGAPNADGVGQNRRHSTNSWLRQIAGYISKTIQNIRMLSIKVECALSNGDIADDLE